MDDASWVTANYGVMAEPLAPLERALSNGEALLILGQDYEPGLVDRVLAEAKDLFGTAGPSRSLADLCTSIQENTGLLGSLHFLFEAGEPSVSTLELASLPWTSVITTAVDPLVSRAFVNVGAQRPLVEVGPGQLSTLSAARSSHLLQMIRAFGTLEDHGPAGVPTNPLLLAEARSIRWPSVVAVIPRLVALHGHVVIEGWSARDWLDEASCVALTVALRSLPPGRVWWFGPAPQSVRHALGDAVHFETEAFTEHLRTWTRDTRLQAALQAARVRVFGVGERTITIADDGQRRQIRLTASEWRSISQIGSILDDESVASLAAQTGGRKDDLVAYLRRSHVGVPDWSGPARGLVFQRRTTRDLVRSVQNFIAEPKESILDPTTSPHRVRRVPYIVAGPPASGKTMSLLLAAWLLRAKHECCVLWLLPGIAGLDFGAVERVCRLLENKGVRWVVLFLDAVEIEQYIRLRQRLESDGRRVLVVGAESQLTTADGGQDDIEGQSEVRRFPLNQLLDTMESQQLREYLASHDVPAPSIAFTRDFLGALASAVPEIEFGAVASLLAEYEQIISEVNAAEPPRGVEEGYREALAARLHELFPAVIEDKDAARSVTRFAVDPLLRDALNVVLFCSQFDRPIPVDFLISMFGSQLISSYGILASALSRTALIQEVDLDQDGSTALATIHQLHATWLLRGLFNNRTEQLDLLYKLAVAVGWDADAYPRDNPFQDYVLDLVRAVGPRGEYKDLFHSSSALEKLSQIIREIRERFQMEQPKLLTLEAIILGDLAVRESEELPVRARERCDLALDLLARAEDLLRGRRATDIRNFELMRVLTIASDIRGTLVNIDVRRGAVANPFEIERVSQELSRIEADAIRAQSYSTSFHPLDVAFWAHRDTVKYLSNLPAALRLDFIETMASVLDVAQEGGLEPGQLDRFESRRQDLLALQGRVQESASLAEEMRRRGNFSGEISLARDRLRDIEQSGGDIPGSNLRELLRLYSDRPVVLQSPHAVRFMHGLWQRAFGVGKLDVGGPKVVAASREQWQMLEEIVRARLRFSEDAEHPFSMFFLGWSLYQTGESREAREVFARLERTSFGNPRRVGELAYLADERGNPRLFRARVVHSRAGQVRVAIAELDAEILDLRPEVETRIAPAGLRLGQYLAVSIALNYRGIRVRPPVESEFGARQRY